MMIQPTYQTVKLRKGKHASPDEGACVMELASMLAGEPFSDHPRSVSRVIASFLRTYNDMLDVQRRQDLYAYAARVVGTAATAELENARAQRLVEWADAMRERRRLRLFAWLRRRRAGAERQMAREHAARYALNSVRRITDEDHAAVLRLTEELIAIGRGDTREVGLDEGLRNPAWAETAGQLVEG